MPPSDPPATAASRSIPSALQQRVLGAHHVRDGDHREVRAVGPPGRRIDGRRPGGAAAATEQVGADHEVAVGVERLAGTDHPVPPAQADGRAGVALVGAETVAGARRGRVGADPGRMGVAAQRVADENDVVARRRQRAVRFVGDTNLRQLLATVQPQRLREVEILRLDQADGPGGGLRC